MPNGADSVHRDIWWTKFFHPFWKAYLLYIWRYWRGFQNSRKPSYFHIDVSYRYARTFLWYETFAICHLEEENKWLIKFALSLGTCTQKAGIVYQYVIYLFMGTTHLLYWSASERPRARSVIIQTHGMKLSTNVNHLFKSFENASSIQKVLDVIAMTGTERECCGIQEAEAFHKRSARFILKTQMYSPWWRRSSNP